MNTFDIISEPFDNKINLYNRRSKQNLVHLDNFNTKDENLDNVRRLFLNMLRKSVNKSKVKKIIYEDQITGCQTTNIIYDKSNYMKRLSNNIKVLSSQEKREDKIRDYLVTLFAGQNEDLVYSVISEFDILAIEIESLRDINNMLTKKVEEFENGKRQ